MDLMHKIDPERLEFFIECLSEGAAAEKVEIARLIIWTGHTPWSAAKEVESLGFTRRNLSTLYYTGRMIVEELHEWFGEPISELVEQVSRTGQAEVEPSRADRLVNACRASGVSAVKKVIVTQEPEV